MNLITSRVRVVSVEPNATPPVALADAKAQIRALCDAEDALIQMYLDTAIADAQNRLQRALVPTRYKLTLDAFVPVLDLLMPPVTSVVSVKYTDTTGTVQTLAAQDYIFDGVSEPARLLPAFGTAWPETRDRVNAVVVEYVAGYATGQVPSPIKSWILLAVEDLYANRGRSSDKPVIPQDFADGLLDPFRIWSF